ncbi:MAG: hypothetical protein GC189_12560 [Alphaproteobacteria bacterium]|nr:hypothetical protein [Alphaproteobacteria bacterium]
MTREHARTIAEWIGVALGAFVAGFAALSAISLFMLTGGATFDRLPFASDAYAAAPPSRQKPARLSALLRDEYFHEAAPQIYDAPEEDFAATDASDQADEDFVYGEDIQFVGWATAPDLSGEDRSGAFMPAAAFDRVDALQEMDHATSEPLSPGADRVADALSKARSLYR